MRIRSFGAPLFANSGTVFSLVGNRTPPASGLWSCCRPGKIAGCRPEPRRSDSGAAFVDQAVVGGVQPRAHNAPRIVSFDRSSSFALEAGAKLSVSQHLDDSGSKLFRLVSNEYVHAIASLEAFASDRSRDDGFSHGPRIE